MDGFDTASAQELATAILGKRRAKGKAKAKQNGKKVKK